MSSGCTHLDYWCYVDELALELEGAPPAPSHP